VRPHLNSYLAEAHIAELHRRADLTRRAAVVVPAPSPKRHVARRRRLAELARLARAIR